MSKPPNFRKSKHCRNCDHGVVTGFDMGSTVDFCDKHKFRIDDAPSSMVCDDYIIDSGEIKPHPMQGIFKHE